MTGAPTLSKRAVAALGAVLFLLLIGLQSLGYDSAGNRDMWGRALLANDGLSSLQDVVTRFPPLPFVATAALGALFPWPGPTAPEVLAVMLACMLACGWLLLLARNEYSRIVCIGAVILLVSNPLFLRAVADGPGFVLLHWSIWLLALGMFNLRRTNRVNDVILISLALIVASFSHSFGLFLALSALPFLALVIPKDQLLTAPTAVFLVLLFPLIFTLAAFVYINWIFAGDPLYFLTVLNSEGSGHLQDGAGSRALGAVIIALIGVLVTCPPAAIILARSSGLLSFRIAVFGLLGLLLAASLLCSLFEMLPAISLVASLGVTLSAACAVSWPRERSRRGELLLLLAAGWIGGALFVFADPANDTVRWRSAHTGGVAAPPDAELEALGRYLQGYDVILFDGDAAPAVVAARGDAEGIWSGDSTLFEPGGEGPGIDADVIVVRSRYSSAGSDLVGQSYPDLFDEGRPGYRLAFDGAHWRAYAREEQAR